MLYEVITFHQFRHCAEHVAGHTAHAPFVKYEYQAGSADKKQVEPQPAPSAEQGEDHRQDHAPECGKSGAVSEKVVRCAASGPAVIQKPDGEQGSAP